MLIDKQLVNMTPEYIGNLIKEIILDIFLNTVTQNMWHTSTEISFTWALFCYVKMHLHDILYLPEPYMNKLREHV